MVLPNYSYKSARTVCVHGVVETLGGGETGRGD